MNTNCENLTQNKKEFLNRSYNEQVCNLHMEMLFNCRKNKYRKRYLLKYTYWLGKCHLWYVNKLYSPIDISVIITMDKGDFHLSREIVNLINTDQTFLTAAVPTMTIFHLEVLICEPKSYQHKNHSSQHCFKYLCLCWKLSRQRSNANLFWDFISF